MLGERQAVVLDVRSLDVHGVGFSDVTLRYPDQRVETARLGAESLPDGLAAGDPVLVTKALNVVVSIRRP